MTVEQRLRDIESIIASKARQRVLILAVTKTQNIETMKTALQAGCVHLAENYVQELLPKVEVLRQGVSWHFIGNLQTNKLAKVIDHVQWIHSISTQSQIEKLETLRQMGRTLPKLMIQVNVAKEQTKLGVEEHNLLPFLDWISSTTQLQINGLMTFPPYQKNPEDNRPYFRKLATLKDQVNQKQIPRVKIQELSMGVSNDYEVAVEEGATMVRLGEAIFGPREPK